MYMTDSGPFFKYILKFFICSVHAMENLSSLNNTYSVFYSLLKAPYETLKGSETGQSIICVCLNV